MHRITAQDYQQPSREDQPSQPAEAGPPAQLGMHNRIFPAASACRPSYGQAPMAPAAPSCPRCKGAGFYLFDVPAGHAAFGQLQRCPCRAAEVEQQRAAERAAQHGAALDRLGSELGRLRSRTFTTFDLDRPLDAWACWEQQGDARYTERQQRMALRIAAGHVRSYAEAPAGWLYLQGPYGSGKSHLAAAVAHAVASRSTLVSYASTPKLLQFIRQGFADHSADGRIEALQEIPLLVLDDIGAEHITGWSAETLFNILHERYNHERPTILTSNVPIEAIGGRLGSRIAELADVVTVIASDYRLLRLQQQQAS